MNKLFCIVGPTGTGKTDRAIELFKQQPSILVSADSRQVYRGMDIVTGKDHATDIVMYGIDIVDPDQPCSVSVWYDAVIPHIKNAWEEGKLPILVGGTGLYVKALLEGIPTMGIPINHSLRDELSLLTVEQLQNRLKKLAKVKFQSMNHSDQNNPRRLIRAIEVSLHSDKDPRLGRQNIQISDASSTLIGLRYFDDSNYRSRVRDRVMTRLRLGAVEETRILLQKYDPSLPSMSAIGYKSLIQYLENQIDKESLIESWVEGELAYAKRQLTWFRKQHIIWYDVEDERDHVYGSKKSRNFT